MPTGNGRRLRFGGVHRCLGTDAHLANVLVDDLTVQRDELEAGHWVVAAVQGGKAIWRGGRVVFLVSQINGLTFIKQ